MTIEPATASAHALRDGMAAAYARQFDRARPLLQGAAVHAPDSAAAWFWLAIAAPSALPAMDCLRRALEIDPKHALAGEALGRLLVAQAAAIAPQDRAKARALLVEASRVAPDLDTVWVALATTSEVPSEVLQALRRAVRLNPQRSDLRGRLHDRLLHDAVVFAKSNQKPEARALFREAAGIDPSDRRVWQALARLADSAGEAIDPLRRLLRAAPGQPGVVEALKKALVADARALEVAGKTREAERRWREVIAADERDASAWLALASLATDSAEIRRAVETAHRLDPDNKTAVAWLARLQSRATAPAAPAATSSRRIVLVVDDSPTIRKILALTLEGAGYTVVAEPDGEHAIQRLAQLLPDLILLDITMPGLDGYEVCKRIKKDPRTGHVPVVMLSGKDGFFDKVKGRMVGATEYLTKPFQPPAVLAVIAGHCHAAQEASHG